MQKCDHCGKKFTGRATQRYCGASCKTAAYRSRKRQTKETKYRTLSSAELKDLELIRGHSQGAYERLMSLRANYGTACFDDALSAVYEAVIDIIAAEV